MEAVKTYSAIILFLISQTVAGVWWASSTDKSVNTLEGEVATIKKNQLDINTLMIEQKHQRTQLERNEEILMEILRETQRLQRSER